MQQSTNSLIFFFVSFNLQQNITCYVCFATYYSTVLGLGEMEQTVCMLERGTIITKYYPRRRPEQKTLMLRRETRQVCFSKNCANKIYLQRKRFI